MQAFFRYAVSCLACWWCMVHFWLQSALLPEFMSLFGVYPVYGYVRKLQATLPARYMPTMNKMLLACVPYTAKN